MTVRVRFGAFEADLDSEELFRDGRRVPLQRQPFQFLAALLERPGELVTRDDLRSRLWPDGTVVDFEHSLNTALRKLRRALGDSPELPRFVETLAGRGYRLLAPVERGAERRGTHRVVLAAALDLEPSALRDALLAALCAVVLALGAELIEDSAGGVTASFAAAGAALIGVRELRGRVRAEASSRPLRLRTGLESDEAGEAVTHARRLRDAAAPGEILVGATLARALEESIACGLRDRAPLPLPGGRELPAFRYEASATSSFLPLARPPFVGREAPFRRLELRLAEASEGRGGVVFVAGEPGIGKTRLLDEFAARARRRDAVVLIGRCVQGEAELPYGAVADAISVHARDAEVEVLRGLVDASTAAVVAKIVPALRERLPALPQPPPLRPDEERHRLQDAIAQTLAALAKRAPLVLIIDDLHWGDAATLDMLLHLARSAAGAPLLIVAAYRDVEVDRSHRLRAVREQLAQETSFEDLPLAGLETEPVRRLIEAAASDAVSDELVAEVQRATDGNPLFVRELLLQWAREGRLCEGADPLTAQELSLPASLRDLVERRFEKLSGEARRLLATASAFQGVFHFDATARAVGLDDDDALDALDEAFEAQLVRPAGSADDYDFSHALIRQTLYDDLTPARRLRVHRRIAEEMARESPPRIDERAAAIAEHYHMSRELPGAEAGVLHALAAAERAESAVDFAGVVRFLRMALDVLPPADPSRPRLLGRLGLALAWSLQLDEAVDAASQAAEAIASQEGSGPAADYLAEVADAVWLGAWDPRAWTLAAEGQRYLDGRRDYTWARLAAHRIMAEEASDLERPGVPRDTPLRREVWSCLLAHRNRMSAAELRELWRVQIWTSREEVMPFALEMPAALGHLHGNYQLALAALRVELEQALERGQLAAAAFAHTLIGITEGPLGNLDAAESACARARELVARAGGSLLASVLTNSTQAINASLRGVEMEATLGPLEPLLRADAALPFLLEPHRACAAYCCSLIGRTDDALRALGWVVAAAELGPGWAVNYAWLLAFASRAFWTLDRAEHAPILEKNLREKTLALGLGHPHMDARHTLALLLALQNRYDEATHWFARAREVLDEQRARPLRALTDFDEAWMYLRRDARGDGTRAQMLLDAAVPQFEAIGMTGWVHRADALRRGDAQR